ncbi:MAG: hypothetical protein PHQ58_05145 [Rhodoferax sp.]|uniref:hypothetical protein n=1 Tax=Rhodoferax sp. TaxID=50421 RepID=UPI002638A05B|nr:hypothetical protein [Rhodoferax sp.]MDD2879801.1 hypothetical protein [Rhodoferax sp.]
MSKHTGTRRESRERQRPYVDNGKGVFSNQLKTVFGEVFDGDMKTEDGELIDAIFGGKSVHARIVNSAWSIGTTNTLLSVLAKKAVQAYRGK